MLTVFLLLTLGCTSAPEPESDGGTAKALAETVEPIPESSDPNGIEPMDVAALKALIESPHPRHRVVNFWATWCGPCIRELPSLARLNTALGGETAQVVLVSQDRGGFKQTDRFLKKLQVDFPDSFIDERLKFSRAIGVVSLPTTILIGPDGKEVGRLVGHAEWDSPEALALIDWYRNGAGSS